jgi:predicted heme/steroid binding protein
VPNGTPRAVLNTGSGVDAVPSRRGREIAAAPAAPSRPDRNGVFMKKSFVAFSLALTAVASVTALAFAQTAAPSDPETVAAITQLENDAVKADLAADSAFYDRYLADDWTGGTSRGTWDSKQSLVTDMKDAKNNKTNSESIRDVKVHVYGDTAIASYTSTYDSMIKGEHYARTVISTDTFMRRNGEWKQIAGHSSQAAK